VPAARAGVSKAARPKAWSLAITDRSDALDPALVANRAAAGQRETARPAVGAAPRILHAGERIF